jgi:hypothetical protein
VTEEIRKAALARVDKNGWVRTRRDVRPEEFDALAALARDGVLIAKDRSPQGYVTFMRAPRSKTAP